VSSRYCQSLQHGGERFTPADSYSQRRGIAVVVDGSSGEVANAVPGYTRAGTAATAHDLAEQ
jgi:hypothetical protein